MWKRLTSDTRIEIVVFRIEIVVFRDLKLEIGIGMCVSLLKLLFNYNEMEKLHGKNIISKHITI